MAIMAETSAVAVVRRARFASSLLADLSMSSTRILWDAKLFAERATDINPLAIRPVLSDVPTRGRVTKFKCINSI